MTEEENSTRPLETSMVEGEGEEQNSKSPYLTTEKKDGGLNEIKLQPKLPNPGSSESTRNSSETAGKLVDSIKNYLKATNQKFSDIVLFFMAFYAGPNGVEPAVFSEDWYEDDDGVIWVRAWPNSTDFIHEFVARKVLFTTNYYDANMIGFCHQVAPRGSEGRIKWPHQKCKNIVGPRPTI